VLTLQQVFVNLILLANEALLQTNQSRYCMRALSRYSRIQCMYQCIAK